MRNLLPFVALGLSLGLHAVAQEAAQPPSPAPRHPAPRSMPAKMAARLHLTEAQKTAMQTIRAKHQESLAAKGKAAEAAHAALAEAMAKPETKVEDLKTLHGNAANLRFELLLEHRAQRQECQALLTPEQREQAARMEGRWQGRREAMRGGRRGPGREFGHPGMGMGMGMDRER